ncbi:MAG: PQQ-binding-like beta-propeller repeat protein, partial [Phycisphaerae bacterium]|nr:PQQ-binding-like beta-propeller repeat protein [Phycisphaerae bacterium]
SEAVELEPLWQASVGLTSWFSTILPIDGQIYIASLGTTLASVDDPWDGVVRVDAETHRGQLIFEAPDRHPRDIIGLALGSNCLFAACRNGFVYALDPDGVMLWRCNTVYPSVSVPLALDVNGDDSADVVVVTGRGTVVSISGRNAKTPWVTPLPGGPPTHLDSPPLVQATLSAGDVLPGGGPEIVVTTEAGDIYVLSVRDGRVLWHQRFMPGQYAAALTYNDVGDNQTAVFIGDSSARIWRLVRSGNGLQPDLLCSLAVQQHQGIVSHLRTLYTADDAASWLLACPTGDAGTPSSSVCLLDAYGLYWRYAPGGVIWSPPAIADVNADGRSEILVTSVEFPADSEPTSLLSILSREGHCLHRLSVPSAIEAAPVVADINGDARLEILVADQAGVLRCYATRGKGRAVEWGLGAGDPCNTHNALNAFSWGQRPAGLQWTWRPDF